jgi:hypothetical protein
MYEGWCHKMWFLLSSVTFFKTFSVCQYIELREMQGRNRSYETNIQVSRESLWGCRCFEFLAFEPLNVLKSNEMKVNISVNTFYGTTESS